MTCRRHPEADPDPRVLGFLDQDPIEPGAWDHERFSFLPLEGRRTPSGGVLPYPRTGVAIPGEPPSARAPLTPGSAPLGGGSGRRYRNIFRCVKGCPGKGGKAGHKSAVPPFACYSANIIALPIIYNITKFYTTSNIFTVLQFSESSLMKWRL